MNINRITVGILVWVGLVGAITGTVKAEWSMAGANSARTSWEEVGVGGNLEIDWYRPIEAYIDQKVQLVGGNGKIFVASSRGLYALDANTGDTVWRYDSELPLGHSPTVKNSTVFFGGYDKKVRALDANNGSQKWEFSGATAGYDTNPIVEEGKVMLGNRDGFFYALDERTGQQLWRFGPVGPINFSGAYRNGIVYFASDDMHAYAVRVTDGQQVWKSPKLPGERFASFWPVIFRDFVVLGTAFGYKDGTNPGAASVNGYTELVNGFQRDEVFAGVPQGGLLGATSNDGSSGWPAGITAMAAGRILDYLEERPWRMTMVYLNINNGSLYSFDSDGDGRREYPPVLYYGTKSGNAYPPIVSGDGQVIYSNNHHENRGTISGGRIMGWRPENPRYLRFAGGISAVDEPQAISGGGSVIYRSLCCDRVGDGGGTYWTYSDKLASQIPGYDAMWVIINDLERLGGSYKGNTNSINGVYHEHGNQNPMIPYNGRVYVHRSNSIIALGSTGGRTAKPLLTINNVSTGVNLPSTTELTNRLASEMTKMIQAGLLKPGYYNDGIQTSRGDFSQYKFYFENPGLTLLTLSTAYPKLAGQAVQAQLKTYLNTIFTTYFGGSAVTTIGWNRGQGREYMDYPPEVAGAMGGLGDRNTGEYPQINLYALAKFAEAVPERAGEAYTVAKAKLKVPSGITASSHEQEPWRVNDQIAGYYGYLQLQQRVGSDTDRRSEVQSELNSLLAMRTNNFAKDHPWDRLGGTPYRRKYNFSRNFQYLVPELGQYLHDHALTKVRTAIDEYSYLGPYWFVNGYDATWQEGVMQQLWDSPSLFAARAYVLQQDRNQLIKYLDVPIFKVGDLHYIQNLVVLLEAGSGQGQPSATPAAPTATQVPARPGDANGDEKTDGVDYVIWLMHYNQTVTNGAQSGDFNNSGRVDGVDYVVWVNNYSG